MLLMGKHQGSTNSKQSRYRPGGPYRGSRVGTVPRGRRATTGGSHAGEYQSPPNGPGPGRAPYNWNQPPSLSAVDFSGGGWVQCDPTSHLQEIRFVYGLDSLGAEGDTLGMGPIRFVRREEEQSVLQVKFREPPGSWACYWSVPGTQYTAERLEAIYLMMESDVSAGEILWSHLIGVGGSVKWPYDTSAR